MDEKLLAAYNSLIPADRTIVDALIFTLANKDKQIAGLCAEINKELNSRREIADAVRQEA